MTMPPAGFGAGHPIGYQFDIILTIGLSMAAALKDVARLARARVAVQPRIGTKVSRGLARSPGTRLE
jgi:hypothetical protein